MDGRRESEAHTYTQMSHAHKYHASALGDKRRGLRQDRNEHLFCFLLLAGDIILRVGRGVRARLLSTCIYLHVNKCMYMRTACGPHPPGQAEANGQGSSPPACICVYMPECLCACLHAWCTILSSMRNAHKTRVSCTA